jgi:hypothetical protein
MSEVDETRDEARKQAAHERAERIRNNLQAAAHDYAVAVAERDWETLGYADVRAWADAELGPVRWKPVARQEIGEYLLSAGFTFRQIAAVEGVSAATVSGDLAGVQEVNTTSGNARQQAARERQKKKGIGYAEESEVTVSLPAPDITVDAGELAGAIAAVVPFAGENNLDCVHLLCEGDGILHVEATDALSAARKSVTCDGTGLDVVLPAGRAGKLASALAGTVEKRLQPEARNVAAAVTGKGLTFWGEGVMLTAEYKDGAGYLPVGKILSRKEEPSILVGGKELARMAKAAGDGIIRLWFGGRALIAETDNLTTAATLRRDLAPESDEGNVTGQTAEGE